MDLVRTLIVPEEWIHEVVWVYSHGELHGGSVYALLAPSEIDKHGVDTSNPVIDFRSQLVCRIKCLAHGEGVQLVVHDVRVETVEVFNVLFVSIETRVDLNERIVLVLVMLFIYEVIWLVLASRFLLMLSLGHY